MHNRNLCIPLTNTHALIQCIPLQSQSLRFNESQVNRGRKKVIDNALEGHCSVYGSINCVDTNWTARQTIGPKNLNLSLGLHSFDNVPHKERLEISLLLSLSWFCLATSFYGLRCGINSNKSSLIMLSIDRVVLETNKIKSEPSVSRQIADRSVCVEANKQRPSGEFI